MQSGDLIEVELVVNASNDYEYLVFEDMKAAGFEPVDLRSGASYGDGLSSNVELRDEKGVLRGQIAPRAPRLALSRARRSSGAVPCVADQRLRDVCARSARDFGRDARRNSGRGLKPTAGQPLAECLRDTGCRKFRVVEQNSESCPEETQPTAALPWVLTHGTNTNRTFK